MTPVQHNKMRALRQPLLLWGRDNYRPFPWRTLRDPFRLALVEVLLRQTNAAHIESKVTLFLQKYQSPTMLAKAPVHQLRSDLRPFGLYKQRASQLKDLGKFLLHAGQFPRKRKDILDVPGLGPYAASAIRCFAYGHAEPVVDVNIARIVQRVFGVTFDRGEPRRNKRILELAQELLDGPTPRQMNWALLDLGALVCTARHPQCSSCPLAQLCAERKSAA